jgi:choline monooxygenase
MFHATSSLPHLLPPRAYTDPLGFDAECRGILRSAWHLVATREQLAQTGDFITLRLLGEEIQIRNFGATLRAFSNVCAHRHCLLTSHARGNSPAMKCQYHGWEYGEDGCSRKIPQAKDVPPATRKPWQLPTYRLAVCGSLVFLCLDPEAPELVEFLGPIHGLIAERFGENWSCYYQRTYAYDANWKVPIENSIEAYHVAAIHPETFRQAPGEERTEHHLNDHHTAFLTDLPFAIHHSLDRSFHRVERWLVKRLGVHPQGRYQQHHLFPNLLFSFTDAISLVHVIEPIAVNRSRSVLRQYGPSPSQASIGRRCLARILGKIEGLLLERIFREDLQLYPAIQSGLQASRQPGILARSEERIHAFHRYLIQHQYQSYTPR